MLANEELAYQNEEKDKRANELAIANKEKDKRANELAIANKEKDKRADELVLANEELAYQNEEKDKRADELAIANKEKDKRADELAIANEEKDKRANELVLANKELAYQNQEKDKRANELVLANKEKEKRADEFAITNKEKDTQADELVRANKELAYQKELDWYRSQIERVSEDWTLFIDTANAPIFGINAYGKINEWNQQSEYITGFTKHEVIGQDLVADFIADDYKVSVAEVLAKALKGEETVNYEFPLFTRTGDRVDVLLNSTTRRDASGTIVGVVGVGQDITELNKVRVEQASIAKELIQLIDTANAPIFGIDAYGRVNEWNQQSEQITGFTKQEVMGTNLVTELISAGYRKSVDEVLQKALNGIETSNYEFPMYTKQEQKLVMVLLNATTRRNANGEVIGVVGVGQDITELDSYRSEMEKKVKERTRLLDAIFTMSPDGFVLIDSESTIAYTNPAFLEMTGLTDAMLVGRGTDIFDEIMTSLLDRDLESDPYFTDGHKNGDYTINLRRPNSRTLSCSHRTMYSLTGSRDGQAIYFRDITSETEVDKMKSNFLSTAAHELRTPLASIYGFSELLLNRVYDQAESMEMIETIHRQSLRLKQLLDELLDLSRIESRAGKDFYMMKDTIEKVVKDSCVDAEGAYKGRKVDHESSNHWPQLSFDSEKMHQVFINLLSNGFKYSTQNDKVILRTKTRYLAGEHQFGICIIDNGIGMAPQQLARLGERFYRADQSGAVRGTGLGVTLVKEIVEIHGGTVDFVTSKGNGMEVTVWLPIVN